MMLSINVEPYEVLESFSDREWIDILKEVDDETLAKAGLRRHVEDLSDLSPLEEHLQLLKAVS